jgi:NTE family protein
MGDEHMIDKRSSEEPKAEEIRKVAVGCQGGGIHAAFEVGVLTEILKYIRDQSQKPEKRVGVELVGLSGTSAGALCALMVW